MAGRIPRTFIQNIVAQTDIVAIVQSRINIQKRGNNYLGVCPFHEEKTPSFTVSDTKQFYHCFGCGANGNVIGFLMDYDKIDFVEAVEYLAQYHHLTIPYENLSPQLQTELSLMDTVKGLYEKALRDKKVCAKAVNYLKGRELSGQTAKTFALGYAPPGWEFLTQHFKGQTSFEKDLKEQGLLMPGKQSGYYDRFRDRVMFPIRNTSGQTIAFGGRGLDAENTPKYLNSPETNLFQKRKQLYGLYECLKADRHPKHMVIVEGYMDVISLHEHGITNAVATLGTAITKEHISLLTRYSKHITFCFDGDNAGRKAAKSAIQIALTCLSNGITFDFIFLDEGLDPDDFIKEKGLAAWQEKVRSAKSLVGVLFDGLVEEHSPSSISGKANLIDAVKALLEDIDSQSYKELIIETLSRYVQIDSNRLHDMLQTTKAVANASPTQQTTLAPSEKFLALMIQNPQSLKDQAIIEINDTLCAQSKDFKMAKQLYTDILETDPISTGLLLENYREHAWQGELAKLAKADLGLPADIVHSEMASLVKHCQYLTNMQRKNALLARAKHLPLSADEKQELQVLITQEKEQRAQPSVGVV